MNTRERERERERERSCQLCECVCERERVLKRRKLCVRGSGKKGEKERV